MIASPKLLALVICSACALAPALAFAGDKALAESLFQEGRKLLEDGKPAEACAKFGASQKQDPSPGTLINLGRCNEAQGKTATAWAAYKEAESLARNMNRGEQEKLAVERAAEVEPKLSRLTITGPPTPIEGLVVRRGGATLSVDALGAASPVDPGVIEIEASAPGYELWKGKVTVGKDGATATIAIPELVKAPQAPARAAAAGDAAGGASAGADVTADTGGKSPTLGYVLTGVGSAFLIAGGVFGFLASKQASDAEDDPTLCPDKQCTSKGRDEIDSAKGKALISTIGIGAGVAALGAGIVLIATSGGSSGKDAARLSRSTRFVPVVSPRGGGIAVGGSF